MMRSRFFSSVLAMGAIVSILTTACGANTAQEKSREPSSSAEPSSILAAKSNSLQPPSPQAPSPQPSTIQYSDVAVPRTPVPDIRRPDPPSPSITPPKIDIPDIPIPDIEIPDIPIPEISIPEITRPELRIQRGDKITVMTIAADILFDFDQATLRPDAEAALQEISAAIANRYAQNRIQINGHTDAIGSDVYNQTLSERRATAVKQWLEQSLTQRLGNNNQSADSRTMTTRGYGESRPVAPNRKPDGSDDPVGRQKNRRVEIVIQH